MANLLSTNVIGRLYTSGHVDTAITNAAFRFYDGTTFRGGLGLDDWAHGGSAANITMYVNGDNNFFISTSGVKRAQFNSGAAIFRTYSADNAYNIRVTGGDQFNAYYNDGAATLYLQYHGGSGGTLNVANGKLTVNTAGSVVASGDMRAPIFYDSNNTSYYLDPNSTTSGYFAGVLRQNDGRYVRDSYHKTISGYSDYYSGGAGGWYRAAEIRLTSNCTGAVLYGTLYDHRYDGADAYQISIVARAECVFEQDNNQHYINVGCTVTGSTAISNYRDKIRLVLVEASSNSRTYELQFYETNWNNDSWQLETTGWTVYSSPQAPRASVAGDAFVENINYISNQGADYQRANSAMYSPIYYDSANTGYYLDPNGNSVLTTANFNVNASSILMITSAGTNASMIKAGAGDELYLGGNNTWQMRFNGGNVLMDNGGYLQNDQSLRAPIFYDSADTSYYLDPNSTSVLNRVYTTGRLEVTYNADRYQMNFLRGSGSNWWVTNDSDKLGLHLNNVGDKFYFGTGGDFWSESNGWLSTALAAKQNASTAITTSNIGSQSVNYANSSGITEFQNIPDNRGSAYQPNAYTGQRVWWHFNNTDTVGGYGTYWHAIQTVSPWTSYDNSHRQQQIQWGGTDISFRYATSGTTWSSWFRFITDASIASQSVNYAASAGSAGTAGSAGSVDGLTINNSGASINPDSVTQNQIGYNTSVDLFGQSDGGLYSSAYSSSWIHQIYGDFRTGQMAIRGKNANTWQAWRIVLDDKNIGGYAVPYGNMTSSTGLSDNKLYLRTNGDNNHYLWNAADDWEEMVYYTGTGFRVKGSTGTVSATFTDSGISIGTSSTLIRSFDAQGYLRIYGSSTNFLGIGPYNNNGWVYFENSGNSTGIYFNTPGRYAFDSADVTPYNDNENSLGNGSYRWANIYTGGWLRNYGAQGIYNESYGTHFYSNAGNAWAITGSGGNVELQFRSNHQSTIRGYVYADTSNQIGFLHNGGGWALRTTSDKNALIHGTDLTINADGATYSNIIMNDGDEGARTIHCNSNRIGFLNQSSSWGSWCYDSGAWATDVAMYSPIYYDSADTGYYLDPNSASILNDVRSYRFKNINGVSTDDNFGLYFGAGDGTSYAIYRESGSWAYPYPDLRIAFHTGIKIGANASYEGIRFYTDYDMSTQVMSVNNGSDPLGGGNVYVNNSLQAGSSLRAPIFYDSNDTTYFLDPNADFAMRVYGEICNSNYADGKLQPGTLNIGRTDTNYAWDGSSWPGDVRLGILINTSETWEMGIHDSGDSVMSLMHFDGGSTITMGRNIGWGQCTVNSPAGYVSNGNAWGTNNSAFFPNGITTAGSANWIYGTTTYIGNAPANGAGHDFSSSGHQYSTGSITTPLFLVNNHSDNTKGYRIHNTSGSSVSAMFVNSSNQLVIAAGAVDQVNFNKKVLVNGVALGVNVAPSATAGRIDASNDIVAYSTSDERFKENITPISNALDKVKTLTGVEFDWRMETKDYHGYVGHDVGVIAQQVKAVLPEAVRTNANGYLAVRYEKLIGLLIEGMKEQQEQIEELKAQLNGLTK